MPPVISLTAEKNAVLRFTGGTLFFRDFSAEIFWLVIFRPKYFGFTCF